MSAQKPRKVSLKIEAPPDSAEAKLLNHIRADAIAPSREIMLRALKPFYLPWALEQELSEAELKSLAQSAIEELQFRIFQIRQRYLSEEGSGYKPSIVSIPPLNGAHSSPNSHSSGTSVEEIRQMINPADLDDF